MKVQYGDACLSQQQVYEWSRKFRSGVTSVANAPHPGQAHRVVTPESIAADLAPSDYHMFGPLKEAMGGKKFHSDEECMSGCADNHKNFFLEEYIHFVNAGGPVLNEMETM
ncbi:hypothetical protein L798_14292 [Zootermopsis nevadensis]|uniref:Mos1 transposase HTH domain-containing protein n=1 Tax=Zootermopsis nevadensis TaxID=136037 RepID=A0A067R277_ZOONE|nr:hypothetical protein L798_14292 [Zootermopsis nevadensis]